MIKTIHMSCAYASISLFLLRSCWTLSDSPIMQQRWVRILPHIIDSILLLAALYMVTIIGPHHPFILVKIILLLVYIGLGVVALKVAKTRQGRLIATTAALLVFLYIIGVGIHKSPASWWA